jgi:ring-1,2-phenylacetyl-CoA epoxidase subunit PaaA
VPFMDEVGLSVPAHHDPERDRYVIDCPFPARFDAEAKRWLLDDGPIGWDEVITRWKGRGPMNREYVQRLQKGYRERIAMAA